ncbi:PadR family transcriptional regulator [Ignicoccus islandicus DSM 13165]|uniref:PadR family transcriptional regulator n=1 Tax=Ignicoccus islandicus DSM 13165 TaxID=940295 RepID=A0A0U3E9K8_9CREN|nr:PadR family transcriptional regulator [Ignicoccus islandicus]ALU11998.1 PadR family transcriptional regulator [Ignicoccus islandicus DSM 13165]
MRKLFEVTVDVGERKVKMNPLKIYIIKSVNEKPKNGYDILREIKNKSNGRWVPPKSTIYPTLKKMVDEGLMTVDDNGVYKITDVGRQILEKLTNDDKIIDDLLENLRAIEILLQEVKVGNNGS